MSNNSPVAAPRGLGASVAGALDWARSIMACYLTMLLRPQAFGRLVTGSLRYAADSRSMLLAGAFGCAAFLDLLIRIDSPLHTAFFRELRRQVQRGYSATDFLLGAAAILAFGLAASWLMGVLLRRTRVTPVGSDGEEIVRYLLGYVYVTLVLLTLGGFALEGLSQAEVVGRVGLGGPLRKFLDSDGAGNVPLALMILVPTLNAGFFFRRMTHSSFLVQVLLAACVVTFVLATVFATMGAAFGLMNADRSVATPPAGGEIGISWVRTDPTHPLYPTLELMEGPEGGAVVFSVALSNVKGGQAAYVQRDVYLSWRAVYPNVLVTGQTMGQVTAWADGCAPILIVPPDGMKWATVRADVTAKDLADLRYIGSQYPEVRDSVTIGIAVGGRNAGGQLIGGGTDVHWFEISEQPYVATADPGSCVTPGARLPR